MKEICRYWQSGSCRFGENCRFQHGTGGINSGNVFANSGGQPQHQQQHQTQDITNTLVQTVKQDLEAAEKGHQWVFSCYSPAKECASIPGLGLDDLSPEELRFEAYEAKNTNPAAYQQKVISLINTYQEIKRTLLNPTPQLREVLKRIYNKEKIDAMTVVNIFSQPATAFQSNSNASLFGGGGAAATASNTSNNIFGNRNSTSSNIFGGNTNQNSGNIFGGGNSTAAGSSNFGLFGGGAINTQQQQQSIFGGNPLNNNAGNIFGGGGGSAVNSQQQQQQQQGIFGHSNPTPSSNNSIFGGNQQTTTQSIFGGQPQQQPHQSSIFGQPATAQQLPQSQGVFGGQQQTQSSVFGQPAQITSPFGTQQQHQQQPQPIFGAPAQQPQQQQSMFGSPLPQQPQPPSQSPFAPQTQQPQQTPVVVGGGGDVFGNPQQPIQSQTAIIPQNLSTAPLPVPPTDSLFGNRGNSSSDNSSGLFGNRNASEATPSGGTGLFGAIIQPIIDPSMFTDATLLTPEEIEAFKADAFVIGKIPERPPPKELCV